MFVLEEGRSGSSAPGRGSDILGFADASALSARSGTGLVEKGKGRDPVKDLDLYVW